MNLSQNKSGMYIKVPISNRHTFIKSSVFRFQFPVLLYFITFISTSLGRRSPPCLHENIVSIYKTSTSNKVCKTSFNISKHKRAVPFSSTASSLTMDSQVPFPNLQKVGLLNNKNILIKNKENVENILSLLLKGSFDNLQLVVDFDYTLTRGHFNGEKSLCSWGILDNSHHMPSFYRDKASELLAKYYPIEVDSSMSEAEKIPHMVEWYDNINELLKRCNVSKELLSDMVAHSNVKLRINTDELFKKLKEERVPTLIFSAGMGDILEHVLWHFDLYSPNVKVVSNFFKYNDEGIMIGFTGDLIHMFNKNENAIHSSNYFSEVEKRHNVILMGDSLGDVKMADGVPKSSNVLKIGFYNHNSIGERINDYQNAYDIVAVNDQTMDIVNSILGHIKV
ncbi:7-methylguanosine phosphate-specific 5'-nucleotidase [Armadillidium nasatum]|uniref:5'-nucleotidase n=1 Tax=Armadillidium nasatum TaxID=96803 RepID=A0A5N5STA8_9CRUS|nr:7-methylguanosine phosphate-specific 5'-nucleotidase [Armadillidium nasatum]